MKDLVWLCQQCAGALKYPRTRQKKENPPDKQPPPKKKEMGMHQMGQMYFEQREMRSFCLGSSCRSLHLAKTTAVKC